jgi:hypothetical protein
MRREDARRRRSERIIVVHLRRIGGKRSTDLVNSGARRLRVQHLGAPSHEAARWQEKDNCWIRNTGGPLDLREGSCLGTSQEKVREFGHGDYEVAR